jgi:hypothetical protein
LRACAQALAGCTLTVRPSRNTRGDTPRWWRTRCPRCVPTHAIAERPLTQNFPSFCQKHISPPPSPSPTNTQHTRHRRSGSWTSGSTRGGRTSSTTTPRRCVTPHPSLPLTTPTIYTLTTSCKPLRKIPNATKCRKQQLPTPKTEYHYSPLPTQQVYHPPRRHGEWPELAGRYQSGDLVGAVQVKNPV